MILRCQEALAAAIRVLVLWCKVLPFTPAVEVDESLHAAPFFDFALEPDEVDGLEVYC